MSDRPVVLINNNSATVTQEVSALDCPLNSIQEVADRMMLAFQVSLTVPPKLPTPSLMFFMPSWPHY